MRVVVVEQPGLGGLRPDLPQTTLPLNATYKAYDAIAQRRKFQERNGWQFLAKPTNQGVADADKFNSVSRARYTLADRSQLAMSDSVGLVVWASGVKVAVTPLVMGVSVRFRDMYADQSLWCPKDGESPMLLFSGTTNANIPFAPGGTFPAGKAVFTIPGAAPAVGTYPSGSYMGVRHGLTAGTYRNPTQWSRVIERVGNNVVMEGMQNVIAGSPLEYMNSGVGFTYPNTMVYGAGTISITSDVATVTGGKFLTGEWGVVNPKTDALLYRRADGNYVMVQIESVPSDQTLSVHAPNITDAPYFIMRRSPFTDACVHKGCPVFSGCAQWPARVYFGDVRTNLGLPPGHPGNALFPVTNDPQFLSTDPGAFELFPIDVPDVGGEPIVAIVNVGDAVLVAKRRAFHAVYGAYPDFQQRVVDDGAGCLHRGGAAQTFSGVFVAGDEALYTWRNGRMEDLSFEKTATIWHSFTRHFDPTVDYVTIGERDAHIFVGMSSDQRSRFGEWIYDLRRDEWMSEITNFTPRALFSGEQGGASVECLAVSDAHPGQVIDAGHMVLETAPRVPDGNGLGPSFGYESSLALGQSGGLEGETILADIAIHARIDSINPGDDDLAVSVTSRGGVRREIGKPARVKTLRPLGSTDTQLVDRYDRRVNSKGRLHSVTIQRSSRARPVSTYCELMQINVSVIDAGMDT